MGTDEVVFNRIFSTESHQQLRLVFDEYQKLTRHPIENAIRGEMSSSVQQAYLTLSKFFSENIEIKNYNEPIFYLKFAKFKFL